jgi:hypothetical protein
VFSGLIAFVRGLSMHVTGCISSHSQAGLILRLSSSLSRTRVASNRSAKRRGSLLSRFDGTNGLQQPLKLYAHSPHEEKFFLNPQLFSTFDFSYH